VSFSSSDCFILFPVFSFYRTEFHTLKSFSVRCLNPWGLVVPFSSQYSSRQPECCKFLHLIWYFRIRFQLFLSHSSVYVLLRSVKTFYPPFSFHLISVQYSSFTSVSSPEAFFLNLNHLDVTWDIFHEQKSPSMFLSSYTSRNDAYKVTTTFFLDFTS
jgi:hypothetical protein